MAFSDIFGGAMSGAATGAGVGSIFPGPGTAIGAGAGALLGGTMGYLQSRQRDKAKRSIGDARMRLEQLARDQRSQRMQDMERAMSYFQPVQTEMTRLYGR